MNKGYILSAAIYINDGKEYDHVPKNVKVGFVVTGRRHSDCYQTLTCIHGNCNKYLESLNISDEDYRRHQGFITSENYYVGRREAWKIAKEHDQIKNGLKASENGDDSILISENLY